jgi:chaperonin GroEL
MLLTTETLVVDKPEETDDSGNGHGHSHGPGGHSH